MSFSAFRPGVLDKVELGVQLTNEGNHVLVDPVAELGIIADWIEIAGFRFFRLWWLIAATLNVVQSGLAHITSGLPNF